MVESPNDLDFRAPTTIHEALSNKHWKVAVDVEMLTLIKQGTWSIQYLPEERNAVGCKWLFKLKRHYDGSIVRNRARLVI